MNSLGYLDSNNIFVVPSVPMKLTLMMTNIKTTGCILLVFVRKSNEQPIIIFPASIEILIPYPITKNKYLYGKYFS